MKRERLIYLFQWVAILPLLCFIFIYTDGLLYLGIAALLVAWLAYHTYLYVHQKVFRYSLSLWLLLGSFYLYGFYGLGSLKAPQTFHTLKENQGVTLFEFAQPVHIDQVCYYVGIDKNVNFVLEYQAKDGWRKFYSYERGYPYSFRWKCIQRSLETQKVLWRVVKNEMMLGEVRFLHKGRVVSYQTSKPYLDDEAKIEIDTSYYGGMFFDEIYFGRTAYEILHHMRVYENTHPYLGKHLISVGIQLFGMTPFGWRFINMLFAGLLIWVFYRLAMQLLKENIYALGASFLMTYSFMHLAQARIGLIDTFGVFFVLLSYLYLYLFIDKQKLSSLLLSGLFFGLAAGVKWSAVFAGFGFILIALYLLLSRYPLKKRFRGKRLLGYGVLAYGVVGVMAYLMTFWDILVDTGSLKYVIDYNLNMYRYHATLQASHPYSSVWWQWPLDIKPMGYYKEVKEGMLHSINAFGNPAIFWLGIVAVCYLPFSLVRHKRVEAAFILFGFVGLYAPYIVVGRLMFIYHFYYAVPFVMLALIYMFQQFAHRSMWGYYIYYFYLILVACLFLAFYPVLSGYGVESSYVDVYLRWFKGWWF